MAGPVAPDDLPAQDDGERRGARTWRRRIAVTTVIAALVAVALWFFGIRAPDPAAVCMHLDALAQRDPSAASMVSTLVTPTAVGSVPAPAGLTRLARCLWYFETVRRETGPLRYSAIARCAMRAANSADVAKCALE